MKLVQLTRIFPALVLALGAALSPTLRATTSDSLVDEKKPSADRPKPTTPPEDATTPDKQEGTDKDAGKSPEREKEKEKGKDADKGGSTPRPAVEKAATLDKAPKGDGKSAASADKDGKPVSRPPLKLQIDTTPINRDAPDRISYAPVVRKTATSVVYVYSTKKVRVAPDLSPFFNDPRFRRFFDIPEHRGGNREEGSRRRAPQQTQQGLGSGVVVSIDGYILTNNHVVEGAEEIEVSIGESTKRYDAKVVGRDAATDIAVLKIDPNGSLLPAVLGDSDQLQVGDVVLAVGNPFGIGQSVSRGIVSAVSRGQLGIEELEDFIQTDAAINVGNSGGALIDSSGRVVGINTAILSSSGGFNGVGLAIPINLARFVAEQIVAKGRVERGFLGVQTQELTEDIAESFGTERGALVNDVTSDSPAEKAGVKAGDVITKVNGVEIRDRRHLQLIVTQMLPGTDVSVEFLRDGKRQTVKAKLGLRPSRTRGSAGGDEDTSGGNDEGVLNGVTVGDITPQLRDEMQIPTRVQGAIITAIDPDSPSAQQGLREGDVIMELDRRPTRNAEEAVKLSAEIEGPKVMVLIWRPGGTRFLVIDESKK